MLIDSHCHIPHKNYAKEPHTLVKEAQEAGVTKLITIGTSLADNAKTLQLAEQFENMYSAIGIYPHDELEIPLHLLEVELQKQLKSAPKVKAVGECGIDITNLQGGRPLNQQIELFERQINLALANNLPIVIHNRNGDDEVLNLLNRYKNTSLRAVFHCFVGTWEMAKKYLALGHFLSFSGVITYKSGVSIHETVINAPLQQILVETDAPYLSPEPHRHMTNEPANARITASKVAALRNIEFAQVCEETYTNTCNFFNIQP